MKVTKENFRDFISAYEEDELFYRDVYLHETQHPETFSEYLETLDKDYIIQHKIFIPAIHNKEWVPYLHRRKRSLRQHSREYFAKQTLSIYSCVHTSA